MTNEKPLISVIIPVYKVEAYLDDCVNSVLNQSMSDFEVILVDDGSTDSCPAKCDEYAVKDSRVTVLHKENGGLSSARNRGIIEAKGEYIIFLDSDDCWMDTCALEKIQSTLFSDVELVVWRYVRIPEDYNYSASTFSEVGKIRCCLANDELINEIKKATLYGCAWNMVIRRNLFLENNLFFEQGVISEDIEWYVRLLLAVESVFVTNFVVNGYRQRGTSISNNVNDKTINDLRGHYKKIMQHINEAPLEKKGFLTVYLGEQIANYCMALSMFNPKHVEDYFEDSYMTFLQQAKRLRSRIVFLSVKVFGVRLTLLLLRIYKKVVQK